MHAGQSSMPRDYFSEIRRSQVGTFRFHTFPTETNCRDERYGDDSAQKRAQDVANEDGSSTARKVEARCRDHTQGGLLCRLPDAVGSVKAIHQSTCFAHNCFAEKAVLQNTVSRYAAPRRATAFKASKSACEAGDFVD